MTRLLAAPVMTVAVAGCTSAPKDGGFSEVAGTTRERTGYSTAWTRGAEEDAKVRRATEKLLGEELTLDEAVRVALLNNRHLQATFERLGIARGAFIQAGVPENPVLGAELRFFDEGTAFEGLITQDLISLLLIPLRRDVQGRELEATKLLVTQEVVGLVGSVKRAYYTYQASRQAVEMLREAAQATKSSYMIAARLREAGNIRQLEVFRERAHYEEAKVQLNMAVEATVSAREQLGALMGLWGEQTAWETPARLAEVPAEEAEAMREAGRAAARMATTQPATVVAAATRESTASVTAREVPPKLRGERRAPAATARATTGPDEGVDEARAERLAGPPTDEMIAGPAEEVYGAAAEAGGPDAEAVRVGDGMGPSEERYRAAERMAVSRSLDLAARRNLIEAQAARVKLHTIREIFPFLDAGVTGERGTDGEWGLGPGVSAPIPAWDWAQGTYPAEMSRLRQRLEEYAARATDIRAIARAAETRHQTTRARAVYYRDVILPLHAALVAEAQTQYNAMQITPFDLLRAKQGQIAAGSQYVAALLEYWVARSQLEQLLDGSMPAIPVPQGGGTMLPLGGGVMGQGMGGGGLGMQGMPGVGGGAGGGHGQGGRP